MSGCTVDMCREYIAGKTGFVLGLGTPKKTCVRLIENLADAAVTAEEPSIKHLMDEDAAMYDCFHDLFETACTGIARPPQNSLADSRREFGALGADLAR